VLLSDTVGFIRNLPTTLVNAFRATLEEVTAAALLLHVVDVTSPTADEQTAHVMRVLGEIGAENTPQILVLNKTDCLENGRLDTDLATITHRLLGEAARQNETPAALISGKTGAGVTDLLAVIDSEVVQDPVARQLFRLPLGDGRALNLLYERAAVISEQYSEEYCEVLADAPQSIRNRLAEFALGDPNEVGESTSS